MQLRQRVESCNLHHYRVTVSEAGDPHPKALPGSSRRKPAPGIDLSMNIQFEKIVDQVSRLIYGKKKQIQLSLTCLFAGGHLLIEDMPGIGKTTLAKVISRTLNLKFARVQYTSDMLPGDLLGVSVFDSKASAFVFHPGPIFSQILLADEINRATPKTQSALLEAMEEGQVTVEGKTRPLGTPFFVIATQNPLEQSGTFSLPESQLDRFLMRISMGYPDRAAEHLLLKSGGPHSAIQEIAPSLETGEVIALQQQIRAVHVSDALVEYVQDILAFTRTGPHFHMGLSPRAGIALLSATRSWAFLQGRDHAIPEDIQAILPFVAGHRLHSAEDYAEFPLEKLSALLMEVPVP